MMNCIFNGVDLVEKQRIVEALERYGDRFLKRIYTAHEIALFQHKPASLAARFAAKEAVSKALGTGIGKIYWTDIEILQGEAGEPLLTLYGEAQRLAEEKGILSWSISLSHTDALAIAAVVALANPESDTQNSNVST